jgi:hypothetical protein
MVIIVSSIWGSTPWLSILKSKRGEEHMIIKLKKPLIGYKKVLCVKTGSSVIVKLEIPKGALVRTETDGYYSNVMLKCGKKRASSARVISLTTLNSHVSKTKKTEPMSSGNTKGHSINFVPGKKVRPHEFSHDDDACAGGIHFFLSRYEAESYR